MANAIRAGKVNEGIIRLLECSTITHMGYLILRLGSKDSRMAHR